MATSAVQYSSPRQLLHCTENPIYVFPEMKLCGHVPNSYIHVSVSDLYIPGAVCLFSCSKTRRPILGIYKSLTDTWRWKLEGISPLIQPRCESKHGKICYLTQDVPRKKGFPKVQYVSRIGLHGHNDWCTVVKEECRNIITYRIWKSASSLLIHPPIPPSPKKGGMIFRI